jgi:hypothetical protein
VTVVVVDESVLVVVVVVVAGRLPLVDNVVTSLGAGAAIGSRAV